MYIHKCTQSFWQSERYGIFNFQKECDYTYRLKNMSIKLTSKKKFRSHLFVGGVANKVIIEAS
jgi:hypothetical protein